MVCIDILRMEAVFCSGGAGLERVLFMVRLRMKDPVLQ